MLVHAGRSNQLRILVVEVLGQKGVTWKGVFLSFWSCFEYKIEKRYIFPEVKGTEIFKIVFIFFLHVFVPLL